MRTRVEDKMENKLNLITEKAKGDRNYRIQNLMCLINVESLHESFYMLKNDKASGIDGVTIQEYGKNLVANIDDLLYRMKRWSYRPQPVRRAYIPKANGKLRPLGIPTVEDKMVQMVITRILNAIYEVDFIENSYGFRAKRSAHHAIDAIDKNIMNNPVNHVIDADIKGFFDNVNHDWMEKFLKHRIDDKNFIRLIKRFLIGGYMEDGKLHRSERGTPQGGIISPILANIYLHYVLDLWVTRLVKRACNGYVEIIRYADDFVILVQRKEEAEKILRCLTKRLEKFGLSLAEDKTHIIGFGRFAEENASKKGQKPKTFNFLGFTHYCTKSRKGRFIVGRKTEKGKFNTKIKELNQWMKAVRNTAQIKDWWKIYKSKLAGHFRYFGVSGNYAGIKRFYKTAVRLLFKWLNRRSQKKSFNWTTFITYLQRYDHPKPKIYCNLYYSYAF